MLRRLNQVRVLALVILVAGFGAGLLSPKDIGAAPPPSTNPAGPPGSQAQNSQADTATGSVTPAAAANGTILAQYSLPDPYGYTNGRAVAFDGSHLWYDFAPGYNPETRIYEMSTDGTYIGSFDTGVGFGALAWDSKRKVLWGGSYDGNGNIYTIDTTTGAATYKFSFAQSASVGAGYIDGLTYDSASDTLWIGADDDTAVFHVGVTGQVLSNNALPSGRSGIAFIGHTLWFGAPDDGQIVNYNVDNNNGSAFLAPLPDGFSTADFATEGLTYDNVTFASSNQCALWANQATNGVPTLTAFAVPCNGFSAPVFLFPWDNRSGTTCTDLVLGTVKNACWYFTSGPHVWGDHNHSLGNPFGDRPGSGLDFVSPLGTSDDISPVVTMANQGVVREIVQNDPVGGNIVKINYGGGIEIWYLHLRQINTTPGAKLLPLGTVIGLEGDTGSGADSPHIHVELVYHDSDNGADTHLSWDGVTLNGWTVHEGLANDPNCVDNNYWGCMTQSGKTVYPTANPSTTLIATTNHPPLPQMVVTSLDAAAIAGSNFQIMTRVSMASNGKPLAGAMVTVSITKSGDNPIAVTGKTNLAGVATLTHTVPGTGQYVISVESVTKPGYDYDEIDSTTSTTITVSQPTAFVQSINLSQSSLFIFTVVTGQVTVHDEGGNPVPHATVAVTWQLPDGSDQTSTASTNASGIAQFQKFMLSWQASGNYTLTVTNITKSGYAYDPTQNEVTSASITVP